jgi:flagellar basal-body rod protein FlgC
MYANAAKIAVAAHNIANSTTDGFKRSTATIESDFSGYPRVTVSRSTNPGAVIPSPEGLPDGLETRELSNVDLADELVQMKIAEYGYRANTSIIRTQDAMLGSIIDIIA